MRDIPGLRKVLDKYFRDDKETAYFHPADLIADEHYLRYKWIANRVVISVGSNEGETTVKVCSEPEDLENIIKTILY